MGSNPFVSCIMPTANRRRFVSKAIDYFLRQDYPNKELVIVDDGDDSIADLVPSDPELRYIRLSGKRTLGAKRNECVTACRGDLIMHWDDDDWMAPRRIRYQVEELLKAGGEVCGTRQLLFYELGTGSTWLYDYPKNGRPLLIGGSLLYTKEFWRRSPFPNCQIGSDTRFIWNQKLERGVYLPDYTFYVAMIHAHNTSPKVCRGSYWTRWTGDLRLIVNEDFGFYASHGSSQPSVLARPDVSVSQVGPTATLAQAAAPLVPKSEQPQIPTYSVIMVAHNALEIVKMSTLRTLRHSAGHGTQFIVVDNASTDGTEEWLHLLARRGDIELLQSVTNIGHGPGIELARRNVRSPYLVTLDSDAFPLCDDWLPRLSARLNEHVKVTGILHHRDYIHPSCLMIHRHTLEELNLSFVAEKDRPSQFDVGERISYEVKQRGYHIAGLKRTSALRRGSVSEPVYLGSEYEGLVYHQWYTTRAVTAAGARVDDVPSEALESSLRDLFERHQAESRTVTVVIGARVRSDEPERLRNLKASLQGLNLQDIARWRYRIVLVEQDNVPRLQAQVAPFVDKYIFAYNPGPYNRGWAFNVGAALPGSRVGALCLIDADILVAPDFLRRCLDSFKVGALALLPYSEVLYLDERSTTRAIHDRLSHQMQGDLNTEYTGRTFTTSQGGCIWVNASLYHKIGGHDERFRGWGAEDREFWDRLERHSRIHRLSGRLLHLHHRLPAMDDRWARANQTLYQELSNTRPITSARPVGDIAFYRKEHQTNSPVSPGRSVQGKREWENWHQWDSERIDNIIRKEEHPASCESTRRRLASVIVRLGRSLLDVGCGPGALWIHLVPHRAKLSWTGVDVTAKMLATACRFFPQVPMVNADVGDLPFHDRSYEIILLRHVLEHLPSWLMQRALAEAIRIAQRAVVVDFYVPPTAAPTSRTTRVGQNFLETQWAVNDLTKPIHSAGWQVFQRFPIAGYSSERDEIWIITSGKLADEWRTPKVSIVMPTYRRPHTIFRTVETIRAQTYSNWELIIIDNAGDARYDFADSRIHLHCDAVMTSASYARNRGLQYVTGDLVCFFDDDDDMFPNYLERFVQAFRENPGANMVRCGMVVSNGQVNYSHATPECCIRRPFILPWWNNSGSAQDQQYFTRIVTTNGWSQEKGDIILIREALCRANADSRGGLRNGRY